MMRTTVMMVAQKVGWKAMMMLKDATARSALGPPGWRGSLAEGEAHALAKKVSELDIIETMVKYAIHTSTGRYWYTEGGMARGRVNGYSSE